MANGFSVVISATDRATATINKVNAGFAGINRRVLAVSAPFERFGGAMRQLGDTSGVTAGFARVGAGMGEVSRHVSGAVASLGRFAPAMGALTGAASVAGIAKLLETWTGFGARLGLDAQRINTSAAGLHGLQGAARLAGSSAEALTSGMQTLGDNLVDAVGGRSPQTIQMLSSLGIGFRDTATGGARLADDVLPEIADKIAALRTPALQARAATALFGGAGEALLPFLRRGAAGIAEYNAQAVAYGVVNERGVAAANAMREAQTRLGLAAEGVAYSVAERLAPVLVPMLTRLADWVASHRDDIAGFFERVATSIKGWVDGGGIDRTIKSIEQFGGTVNDVVQFFGGWGVAAEVLGAALAIKVLGPMVKIAAQLAFFTAWKMPTWLATMLGVGTTVTGYAAAAGLAAGAAAGHANAPMVDDMGRVIGNWGGADGEASRQAAAAARPNVVTPEEGLLSRLMRGLFGGSAGIPGRVAPFAGSMQGNRPGLMPGAQGPVGAGNPGAGGQQPVGAANDNPVGSQGDPNGPRGIRNNNPLNLSYRPGQQGLDPVRPSDGRFGRYTDMEGGVAAAVRQLQRYQDQGLTTIGSMINRWAPPNENDTAGYARQVAGRMGLAPGSQVDMRNPAQAAAMVAAMARIETGREIAASVVQAGVARVPGMPALPLPPVPPPVAAAPAPSAPPVPPPPPPIPMAGNQGAPGPNGQATVRLSFDNAPPGLRSSVVQQGGLRIEHQTLGNAA